MTRNNTMYKQKLCRSHAIPNDLATILFYWNISTN